MARPIPEYGWQAVNLTSVSPTLVGESNSLRRHKRALPAHRWQLEFTTPPLNISEQRTFFAFLTSLRGQIGSFDFVHPIYSKPRGNARGGVNGLVTSDETIPGSTTIDITGGFENTYFEAGDLLRFEGHGKVYQVMERATFNDVNLASVKLNQALIKTVARDTKVTHLDVPFTLSMTEDEITVEMDGASGPYVEFTVVAVEDI